MKKCISDNLKAQEFTCDNHANEKVVLSNFRFSQSGNLIDSHDVIYTCSKCKKKLEDGRKPE
jgi:hypothetical protein